MKIKSLVEALLVAFFVRLILHGASIGDSFAVISLIGYMGYGKYLEKLQVKDPSVELSERIKLVEERTQKTEQRVVAITAFGRK